jgi:very-short-patch-repair endonuclease
MSRKKTTKIFIEEALKIHGELFDYSEVEYKNYSSNVRIICRQHGIFEQRAGHHLQGSGCSKCSNTYHYSTDEWVSKAKLRFGEDRFDYSKVIYKHALSDVIIICKTCHNEFTQTPSHHMESTIGCDWCRKTHMYTTQEWIRQSQIMHSDTYDYSKSVYKKAKDPISILCKIHGEFNQSASDHLKGAGCSKCAGKYSPTTEEFIAKAKQIHGDLYDYSNTVYKHAMKKIIITCKIHGDFGCTPANHISEQQSGCPDCIRKSEGRISEFLNTESIDYVREWSGGFLGKKRVDFKLKDFTIVIELDGIQHFTQVWKWSSPEEQIKNDIQKIKLCIQNNISVIRLYQPDIKPTANSWQEWLFASIEYAKADTTPICIFPQNDCYKNHIIECINESIPYVVL